MQYCSVDRLQDFNFHDAEMKLESFSGNTLLVSVRHLNIHKNTQQNTDECDLELAEAKMTFTGFSVLSYEPDRTWKTDADGNSYSDDPVVILTGDEAEKRLLRDLKYKLCVLSLEEEAPCQIVMDGCGDSPYFIARIAFDSVRVEWDAYRKKAWYELHRYSKRQVCLATPDGDQKIGLIIYCHDEDVYNVRDGKILKAPLVSIHLQYGGQDYRGLGNDDYWIDAFADLQNNLPRGISLKCCLTCRHGNLCPFGNNIDELFCTRDVSITQKSDLYFYAEDPAQREKRRRSYTDVCTEFQPQTEECFTYNDYLHYLNI